MLLNAAVLKQGVATLLKVDLFQKKGHYTLNFLNAAFIFIKLAETEDYRRVFSHQEGHKSFQCKFGGRQQTSLRTTGFNAFFFI